MINNDIMRNIKMYDTFSDICKNIYILERQFIGLKIKEDIINQVGNVGYQIMVNVKINENG